VGEMSAGDSSDELDVFSSGDESDGADAPPLAPSQRCPLSCSPWNELQALGYQLGDRVQGGAQRQTKQMVAGATIMAEKLERALFAPEVVDSEAHSRPVWNKFEGCVREQNWRWDGGSRCAGARVPLLAAIGFAGSIPPAQRSARHDTLVASMLFAAARSKQVGTQDTFSFRHQLVEDLAVRHLHRGCAWAMLLALNWCPRRSKLHV
jgi:hypothetical protein